MKIAYVSDTVYPFFKGGKEKRLYELATSLAAQGHDVHIYTMKWWEGEATDYELNGLHLHAISKLYPLYKGNKRSIKEGVMFGLACFKTIRITADVVDVDHMPFFPVLSTWLARTIRGKKLHGTWHEALSTSDWIHYMGKSGYIASIIERISIRLPYAITAASSQTQRLLASYHKRDKRVGLVTSGIDTALIRRTKAASATCDVLYVGRLVKDKRVDLLIDAFAIVAQQDPKVRCMIIGDGIEKAVLTKQIKQLKLRDRITIVKPLADAADIYAHMKRAKVFVLPSIREGFGIVALESLACGTPVVTVDTPANAAKSLIAHDRNGSVVALTAEAVAEGINTWLHKKAERFDAREYDWNVLAARQEEVYAL